MIRYSIIIIHFKCGASLSCVAKEQTREIKAARYNSQVSPLPTLYALRTQDVVA